MTPIHIAHLRASEFYGGPERAILGQVRNMPDYDFTLISFVRRKSTNRFLEEASAGGIRTEQLAESAPIDPRPVLRLRSLVRELSIDIVVSHDYKSRVTGHLALRSGSTIHIGHFRGTTREDYKVRFYNLLDRITMRRLRKILTVSRKSAELLRRNGIESSAICVIPNAIETGKLAPESFTRESIKDRQVRIVAAGRLSHEKGYDILIDAISALVSSQRTGFHVTIYGDGPEESRLRNRIMKNNISPYVTLAGFVDDILPVFERADMLVLPSRSEGMPNVILEAWSQKTAVLSTAVGGVPEMITDGVNGRIVEPENPAAMATALAEILSQPESVTDLGRAGYSTVRERYLFGEQARLLDRVYRSLVVR